MFIGENRGQILKPQKITSLTNPRIQHLKKLFNDKEYRYANKEYVAEGIRVLDNIPLIKELFVCEGVVFQHVKAGKIYVVDKKVFEKVAQTEHSQGVIAVAELKILDTNEISEHGRYVLLDGLQDPGNMGSIIRTACAFSLDGVIITKGCVNPFSPKVVRSAASAIEKIDIINLENLIDLEGYRLIAADTDGKNISNFCWPDNFILAIGNEANGLSSEIRVMASDTLSIPICSEIESLNAAISAGILLYAATRLGR